MKSLPLEIIEQIFSYCDCTTLKVIKRVNHDWKHLVDSLIKKRCLQNIPDLDLIQYKYKRVEDSLDSDETILENICENWEKWQNIEGNIIFKNVPFIYEIKYVSCVSAFEEYVAIGLDTGAVKLYNQNEQLLKTYEPLVEREPQTINFVPGVLLQEPIALLVEYTLVTCIQDFSQSYQQGVFEHQRVFASHKQYICGVGLDGTATIAHIYKDEENNHMSFFILKLVQIQEPITNNIFASLSQDKCMILSDDKVLVINYKDDSDNIDGIAQGIGSLDFAMNSVPVLWRDALIFYNKVIITNSQPRADTGQIFEIFVLDNGIKNGVVPRIPSMKMFYLSEVFESLITCVYFYGNTLVLGFANGEILFYEIRDFESFDLNKYSKLITMFTKLGRILSIDVVESCGKREFYVAGPTFVRKITGKYRSNI